MQHWLRAAIMALFTVGSVLPAVAEHGMPVSALHQGTAYVFSEVYMCKTKEDFGFISELRGPEDGGKADEKFREKWANGSCSSPVNETLRVGHVVATYAIPGGATVSIVAASDSSGKTVFFLSFVPIIPAAQ